MAKPRRRRGADRLQGPWGSSNRKQRIGDENRDLQRYLLFICEFQSRLRKCRLDTTNIGQLVILLAQFPSHFTFDVFQAAHCFAVEIARHHRDTSSTQVLSQRLRRLTPFHRIAALQSCGTWRCKLSFPCSSCVWRKAAKRQVRHSLQSRMSRSLLVWEYTSTVRIISFTRLDLVLP